MRIALMGLIVAFAATGFAQPLGTGVPTDPGLVWRLLGHAASLEIDPDDSEARTVYMLVMYQEEPIAHLAMSIDEGAVLTLSVAVTEPHLLPRCAGAVVYIEARYMEADTTGSRSNGACLDIGLDARFAHRDVLTALGLSPEMAAEPRPLPLDRWLIVSASDVTLPPMGARQPLGLRDAIAVYFYLDTQPPMPDEDTAGLPEPPAYSDWMQAVQAYRHE